MTKSDVKKRLKDIRKSLDAQISLVGFVALSKEEAEVLILLIDTFLRWDYDI